MFTKKVVYFLGAGFSAPAGIPVASEFLFKSRYQFALQQRYAHFQKIYEYIDRLVKTRKYMKVNLYDIEEIFSLASMHTLLGENNEIDVEKFIKDVITDHTPGFDVSMLMAPMNISGNAVNRQIFGSNKIQQIYVGFIFSLIKGWISLADPATLQSGRFAAQRGRTEWDFKFITLNYDLLLEESARYIRDCLNLQGFTLPIAKLHGSVDTTLVPPSWNKRLDPIEEDWRKAAQWLTEANEIRILGYSLPVTDTYVKHLFSLSLANAPNLQNIDVLCLDPDGAVKSRYDDLFDFPKYNFVNGKIEKYLDLFVPKVWQLTSADKSLHFALDIEATQEKWRLLKN